MLADEELIRLAAAGDRAAVAGLYDRYASTLLGIALRVLANRSDAEDVVHDLFVSLPVRARHYAAERGTTTAWLVILARNLSIDRLRRRQSHDKAIVAVDPALPDPTPEANAGATARGERVRRALATLPELQRAAVLAAFFEGLTQAQIAEREGVPLGTIKSRCSRAIATLREALGDEGLTVDDVR